MNFIGPSFSVVGWFTVQRIRAYQAKWSLVAFTVHLFVLFPGRDLRELTSPVEPG